MELREQTDKEFIKDIKDLRSKTNHVDFIDIYRTLYWAVAECILLSGALEYLPKLTKGGARLYPSTDVKLYILSYQNSIKLELRNNI